MLKWNNFASFKVHFQLQNMANVKYADTSLFIIMYQILENQIPISKNSMNWVLSFFVFSLMLSIQQ